MLAAFVLAAVVSQPGTYRIDPHQATAGFELKATMHTVHGNTGKVSGEVHVVPEESGGLALTGKIEIQAATLETGNVKRDATMHDTSLDVAEFPAIALEPERFTPSGPPAADGSVSGQILGRLKDRRSPPRGRSTSPGPTSASPTLRSSSSGSTLSRTRGSRRRSSRRPRATWPAAFTSSRRRSGTWTTSPRVRAPRSAAPR
jgi:hypothetical protein